LLYTDFDPETIDNFLQNPREQLQREPANRHPDGFATDFGRRDVPAISNLLKDLKQRRGARIAQAIERGNVREVHKLLSSRRVNSRYEGKTYLHIAATNGQLSVVKMLVEEKNAITRIKSELPLVGKRTPAQVAAYCGHKEVFEYLVQQGEQSPEEWQGVVSDMLKDTQEQALEYLTWQPRLNKDIIDSLCNNKMGLPYDLIEVNLSNNEDGTTLLHDAAYNPEMTQLLLQCGANPFALDRSGRTPFDAWSSLNPAVDGSKPLLKIFFDYYREDAAKMTLSGFPNGDIDLSQGFGAYTLPTGNLHWLSMPENCVSTSLYQITQLLNTTGRSLQREFHLSLLFR
jgi:hypothetical protein